MKQAKHITNYFTPLVQSITQGSGTNALNFSYTYDSRGYITSETRNGVTTTYEYDSLGQLTRVNDPNDPTAHNEGALSDNGTTWIYAYDRGGNILSKTAYEYTTGAVGTAVRIWLYEYSDTNWKDKLTKFDGNTITYDTIGNPLNDGTWTYAWQAGRQLKSMSKVEGGDIITMEFTYNHAGLRTKKVKKVNGIADETTEYILNGKNVVELIHTNHDTSELNRLHFYYDAQGRVTLVDFNGTLYSYAHNLQGDVIGLLDSSGNLVVEYKYDAWGKPIVTTANSTLTTTLGELNPFRYRGYVWVEETKLYDLINRYYSARITRFLNSDIIIISDLYVYCDNNPLIFLDNTGLETTYALYWNICKPSSKDNPGHYDFTIVPENNADLLVTIPVGDGRRTIKCGEYKMTFSYGDGKNRTIRFKGKKVESKARLHVYLSDTPQENCYHLKVISGISQSAFDDFNNWLYTEYAILGEYDNEEKNRDCYVVQDGHAKYDAELGPYCGSETGFLTTKFVGFLNKDARIHPKLKEMCTLLMNERVITPEFIKLYGLD